jgi:hypothetical protein
MSRAEWVIPTSNEVMNMNAINHKSMITHGSPHHLGLGVCQNFRVAIILDEIGK